MFSDNVQKLFYILDNLKIEYKLYNHVEMNTVDDINKLDIRFHGQYCKNLFLKNSKGDIHYLVILMDCKRADLKKLAQTIHSTRLSFDTEENLYKYLKLKPGSVTPFGLINDFQREIVVLIDSDLIDMNAINFHPNINTSTITVSYMGLKKFLDWHGNKVYNVCI
ncbi:prolyl-tRNA synthetase associated domain-containing protein [Clostridium sp. BJN0013]|uniref:prolyl-tRNA synthetase associated domain-containing protein n=1 Tax=Clostridium sp. BJN0013 TaxID=3236840 RepID=UPI0034C6CA0B